MYYKVRYAGRHDAQLLWMAFPPRLSDSDCADMYVRPYRYGLHSASSAKRHHNAYSTRPRTIFQSANTLYTTPSLAFSAPTRSILD